MKQDWIDLAPYGLKLSLVKVPSGLFFLVVSPRSEDEKESTAKQQTTLQSLGFRRNVQKQEVFFKEAPMRSDKTLDLKLRPDGSIELIKTADYLRSFPKAELVEYDKTLHYVDRSVTAAPAQDGQAQPATMQPSANAKPVGINKFGHEVLESDKGRFAKDERGRISAEAETDPPNPGLFLRAVDPASLQACADGFVEEAGRGKILRADDFKRFLSVIYPGEPTKEQIEAARAAVQVASASNLARRGGKTLREAFIWAGRLHGNLAFLTDGRGTPMTGMPAPLAVAAQRLAGTEAELKDRTVTVFGAGAGHVLSHLPKSANVVNAAPGAAMDKDAVAVIAVFDQEELKQSGAKPKKGNGGPFKRLDLARALDILDARAAEGMAVFVLDPPADEAERDEMERFRDVVSRQYAFEGEAKVDGALWRGRPDAEGRLVVAVGYRRSEPSDQALPPPVREIHDWGALWSWTAEVVTSRTRGETKDVRVAEKVELGGEEANLDRNNFQTPYVSASRVGTPTTMVPRNLEGATREALARVSAKHGDIDAWVAREFGYDAKTLAETFSPEQVDSLALYLDAEERGRGFLIADQTGIGKGRQLAAIMRRAALRAKKVLFLTERQQNLSDIWRDVVHTGSKDEFKPMVINDGVSIIDEKTKTAVMRSAPREDVDAMLSAGNWPGGVNLVMGTYSQFSRAADGPQNVAPGAEDAPQKRDPAAKSKWLASAVDKDTIVLLDESHNAASGDSNVSKNMTKAVEACGGVVFSSATFAKNAENMAFYAPLFPDGLSANELATMMAKGGETFQEVLSGMLVQDGVMIRREFDLSKVTFETVMDTPRFERNRGMMDAIAPVLAEMAGLSGDMDRRIAHFNDEARRVRRGADEQNRRVKPMQISRTGFGSPLYTIARLFVASLKIDAVVDQALDALRNNEKPVIVVENTVQSLLEELAETDDSVEGTVVADFRALFHRSLRQMTTTQYRDQNGKIHRRDMIAADAALQAQVDKIRRMIDALPHIPVSAIDEVKSRIQETGFTCDEITGRTLEVRNGKIMRRAASNPTVVKNAFNSGEVDALVINVAGSTGIDLHASSRFADQRRRALIELQAPADILRKIQSHGRVNRFDQVQDPRIVSIVTGLPIEMRLCAMENAKLRRLSANTTSNRDAAILARDIPDLINPIGDVVCSRYAEARPDLMRRLGFKVGEVEVAVENNQKTDQEAMTSLKKEIAARKHVAGDEAFRVTDTKRTANEILARLIMLPVSVQERVCTELTAEFYAAVEELEARGETPLKTDDLQGIVHPRTRQVFDGAELENPTSVFHEPLYAVEAALERTLPALRKEELLDRIQIGSMGAARAQPCIDRLRNKMEEILEPYLPVGVATVADALQRGVAEIVRRKDRIDRLAEALGEINPGKEIHYTVDGEVVRGIVTRVDYPNPGYEHVPGAYSVEFAVPGDARTRRMRLETLLKDPAYKVTAGLEAEDYDKILKKFDDAQLSKLTPVTILVHNIYRAMRLNVEHGLGRLMTFVNADGTRHRGVVLSRAHRELRAVPVEMQSTDMAHDALMEHDIVLCGSSAMEEKMFSLRKTPSNHVEARLPPKNSRKYGYIYDHPKLVSLLRRDVSEGKGAHQVTLTKDEIPEVLAAFHEVGTRFYTSPVHRQWAVKWMSENQSVGPDAAARMRA